MNGLRLNLGCGARHLDGFLNVDRYGSPDLTHDLEMFPWPWAADSAGEIVLNHVLEHLGETPKVYLGVIQEMYRVCRDGATIRIAVPHHRHDHFHDDPTHVRAVTPLGLSLFSQKLNRRWVAQGLANSPLGLQLGVDFDLIETRYRPGEIWYKLHPGAEVDLDLLLSEAALHNNLIQEIRMVLRAVKPPGRAEPLGGSGPSIAEDVEVPRAKVPSIGPQVEPIHDRAANRRILFVSHACHLDDSNGAASASRALMQALARRGFATEVLCGAMLDINHADVDPARWLAGRGHEAEELGEECSTFDAGGFRPGLPPHFRLIANGVPVIVHRSPTTRPHDPGEVERAEFLQLLKITLDRFRPDVLVGYGGTLLALETFAAAKARGIVTVFTLHNFSYTHRSAFADIDAVTVPSRFSADHYARTLGLSCNVMPNLSDPDRVRVGRTGPQFVTFVNPSFEKGVYAFARIADELGRRRPDIPLLVVEGRGDEATLVGCGIDLRAHGTVHLIDHPPDPRRFWEATRILLMPSLWWESQGLVAVEAMFNGIPVIASSRGALPETLGSAGIVLPLPERLTLSTRELPTPGEVEPWVEAIIRLWDDEEFHAEHGRRALAESRRWEPDVLEPRYVEFFRDVRAVMTPAGSRSNGPWI